MSTPVALDAIVVGSVDTGEADRVVRLLTPGQGRVHALARRARAPRPRFGGVLDLGNQLQVKVAPGRDGLWHLHEATLQDGRLHAREDLDRLALLAYACELCGALAAVGQAEPRLYGLLETAAVLLDALTGPPGPAFRAGLEGKALTFAGVLPRLDACVVCGEAPGDGPLGVAPARGGLVHGGCGPAPFAVSPAFLAALEAARRRPLRDSVDAPLPPGPAGLLAACAEAALDHPLRSRAVLDSLPPAATAAPG